MNSLLNILKRPKRNQNSITCLLYLMVLLGTTGCDGTLRDGDLIVCVKRDGTSVSGWDDGDNETIPSNTVVNVAGVVTKVFKTNSFDPSERTCTTFFTVEADGVSWEFGYSILDANDDLVNLEIDISNGREVNVAVIKGDTWGWDLGFSVVDATGLVAAFEEGVQGDDLSPEIMDGLSVERGSTTAERYIESCGTKIGQKLVFKNKSSVEVRNNHQGTVDMGTYKVKVRNVSTWKYGKDLECTDIWGPNSFAAWRLP